MFPRRLWLIYSSDKSIPENQKKSCIITLLMLQFALNLTILFYQCMIEAQNNQRRLQFDSKIGMSSTRKLFRPKFSSPRTHEILCAPHILMDSILAKIMRIKRTLLYLVDSSGIICPSNSGEVCDCNIWWYRS